MYILNETQLSKVRGHLDRLNKKAAHFHLQPLVLDTTAHQYPVWIDAKTGADHVGKLGETRATEPDFFVTRWHCELTGDAPVLTGHELIGKVEHLTEGNILNAAPGCTLDEKYRKVDGVCQHCGTNRRRHDTFIIRETATGSTKQIGRNCLADYLRSPEAGQNILAFFEGWDAINRELGEADHLSGGSGNPLFSVKLLTALSAAYAERNFWVSAAKAKERVEAGDYSAQSSARLIGGFVTYRGKRDENFKREYAGVIEAAEKVANDPKWNAYADEVVAWVDSVLAAEPENLTSNYSANLVVLFRAGAVDYRHISLVCSAFRAYEGSRRERQEQAAKDEKNSKKTHLGELKARLPFHVTVKRINGPYTGQYGDSYCCIMTNKDEAENEIIWWTGDGLELEEGNEYKILATVTDHGEYAGAPQTKVNRVKELTEEEYAAAVEKIVNPKPKRTRKAKATDATN